MMDWTWLITAGALAGTVLNIYKRKEGFILWALTNAIWTAVNFDAGAYALSAQFFVYIWLAVWGYWSWRK